MGLGKDIKFFLIRRVLNYAACCFIKLYAKTIRLRFENVEERIEYLENRGRIILACWHQRFFGGFYFPRAFQKSPHIMISQSRDGDFIADVVRRIGWIPVRGSSSKGGRKALQEMIDMVTENGLGAHIVDGPTGPARVIKPGLIFLAQKTGAAIVAGYISYENPWVFNSWDRFMIPKPFSRVLLRAGPLIPVPQEMDEDEFERVRLNVEKEMIKGYEEADRYWSQGEMSSK
jgi:lysophospholipid acyltransferase (LPLAT)-like uncharacterized protein